MRELVLCTGCARHVYEDDVACPFCGESAHAGEVRARMPSGLSRAAVHAARAALVIGAASAAGCYKSHGIGESDGSVSDASVPRDATFDVPGLTDAARPDARIARDAGPADAGPDIDASELDAGDDVMDIPLYGGIFPDPRKRAVV